MSATAILLAAGSGSRMQGCVDDKILVPLNGQPVFIHSVKAFLAASIIDRFTIVFRDDEQRGHLKAALDCINLGKTEVLWALGGDERQDSVYNALKIQPFRCKEVFIHDCARPFITVAALQALKVALKNSRSAVLAHPIVDTVKRVPKKDSIQQVMLEDLDRSRLWAMETPQAFDYPTILEAHHHVRSQALQVTDDTAAAASIGVTSTLVPNHSPNPKITTPADIAFAEWLCEKRT
ncbi:MAG: IspD/TarI family cytidylyltransferase [Opitutaceae bacterium]